MKIAFRQFYGPSVYAPFPAVRAAFQVPIDLPNLDSGLLLHRCIHFGLDLSWSPLIQSRIGLNFEHVAGDIARYLQCPDDPTSEHLLVCRDQQRSGCAWIFLGYIDAKAAMTALQAGLQVAIHVFSSQEKEHGNRFLHQIDGARRRIKSILQWSPKEAALRKEAKRRNIPIYSVASGSQVYQFGQGASALHCIGTVTSLDSWTGNLLSFNKMHSNQLVSSLGFPGVQHFLATSFETALARAAELGYPVVVKPLAALQAVGVSAWIRNSVELKGAFEEARHYSPHGVIIEKKVEGTVYRLGVSGYELAWAEARHPPAVMGDGCSSIDDLIKAENSRRETNPRLKEVIIDQALVNHLGKQGLALSSRPAKDSIVTLRSTTNYATGGTSEDVLHRIHPENRAMAEAIARAFRLFTVGIDFIISDIEVAWSEVPCSIIEVNGDNGFDFESDQASRLLDKRFPRVATGRIPSCLLINVSDGLLCAILDRIKSGAKVIGFATEKLTMLRGLANHSQQLSLGQRIDALIRDPSCEAIIVAATDSYLLQSGLPLDYFDASLFPAYCSGPLKDLLKVSCKDSRECPGDGISIADLESVLLELAILP